MGFNIMEYETIFQQSIQTDDVTQESSRKRRKVSNIPNTPENRHTIIDTVMEQKKQGFMTGGVKYPQSDSDYDPEIDENENIDECWKIMKKKRKLSHNLLKH